MADISKAAALEIVRQWEKQAEDYDTHQQRRETYRECADLLRMMVEREPPTCPRAPSPFRYCPDCDPATCAMKQEGE